MADRKLSPEEVKSLGLEDAPLAPEAAVKLGLDEAPPPEPSTLDRIGAFLKSKGPDLAGRALTAPIGVVDTVRRFAEDPKGETGRMRSGLAGLSYNVAPYIEAGPRSLFSGEPLSQSITETMGDYEKAKSDFPEQYMAGVVGSPNPLSKAGLVGRLAFGSGSTALSSKAAHPEESLKDTAAAGAMGLAGAGVGEVAGRGLGALRGVAQKALGKIEENAAGAAAKSTLSARGTLGQQSAQAIRARDLLKEASSDPFSPHILKAQEWLKDPKSREAYDIAIGHYLEHAPGAADELSASRQAYKDLLSSEPQRARDLVAEKTASPLADSILPRLQRYAGRAAGAAVGGVAGGPAGALVGGAVAGNPGTAAANMVRSPQFQYGAANAGMKALGPVAKGAQPASRGFAEWLQHEEAKDRLKNDR